MEINRFDNIKGKGTYHIRGTSRYEYIVEGLTDAYDIELYEQLKRDFTSEIYIYDYRELKIYNPFGKEKDVVFCDILYYEDALFILKLNWKDKTLRLYKYRPENELEEVFKRDLEGLNMYNLRLVGQKPHIVNLNDVINVYYPFDLEYKAVENECVIAIDDYIYSNMWQEEEFNGENCPLQDYIYHDEFIIRDLEGKIIKRELGTLSLMGDGKYYLT